MVAKIVSFMIHTISILEIAILAMYSALFLLLTYFFARSIIVKSDNEETVGWVMLLAAWASIFFIVVGNMRLLSYTSMQEISLYGLAICFGIGAIVLHRISKSSPL